MNKIILAIVSITVVTIAVTVIIINKNDSHISKETKTTPYTRSSDQVELTRQETTPDDNVVWVAKLTASSGGHSLTVKEINKKTGLVTLVHKKPGVKCMVTQAFETIEATFTLDASVDATIEVLDATYEC